VLSTVDVPAAARRRCPFPPRDGRPLPPPPKLGGTDAPHVWAAQVLKGASVIRFEAEGFRAKIYRTASSRPIEEDVQDNHHRRHTWEMSVSGRAI
jgi:hypothetical protein